MPVKQSFLLGTLIAAILGCASFTAWAAGLPERAKLAVGVSRIVPPYVAGAKYRTSESIETILAKDIAARLKVPLTTLRATPANRMQLLASGKADVVLAAIADTDPFLRNAAVVPTGYSAAPLAILRTDTDIKQPEQLKGRTVCLSEGGAYVGTMVASYGALEKITKAPADSLLALRSGACDAAVHDETMLIELIKLPEWKKFSARLKVGPRTTLVLIAPAGNADTLAFLKKTAQAWAEKGYWTQIKKKWASDVAFEVYLDQNVPDCH
ncbi:MAG: transporter substrate-binding domain-containing protein [Glaciimonas sp.]|nr:transporter substrate-binding domain-containing protein [Glaciimonas sp.]